jgi:hypothetical protein
MAQIKWSALVASASGKLNGSVFSRNRAGQYIRTKVTPSNPQTPAQQFARANLTAATTAWRSLTQDQRDVWNAYAEQVTAKNIFGDSVILTGAQLFVRINANLLYIGQPIVPDVPDKTPADPVSALSISAAAGTPALSITFAPTPVPSEHVLSILITPQIPPSRGFVRNSFRLFVQRPAAATSPYNGLSLYTATYGPLMTGQRIAVRAFLTNVTSGLTGTPLQAETFVHA